VKLGIIARGEDRGLGVLTWEACRHLRPERVLLIDPAPGVAKGFDQHAERFPGATLASWAGEGLDERTVRRWLAGLDVVYTAETSYDPRLYEWARQLGVRTVLHVMPEFLRPAPPELRPDVWWTPTPWRLDRLPPSTVVVPVPVATDRFDRQVRARCDTLLHVAGHRAAADRNGTTALLASLRYLRTPTRIVITGQDGHLPAARLPSHVELVERSAGVADYWQLYDEGDALVLPRRYGGLSLPAQEAMAAGMALVMTDCEPQRTCWPIIPIAGRPRGELDTPSGPVPLYAAHPATLAAAIDRLLVLPSAAAKASAASLQWAATHSWQRLAIVWRHQLEAALA
jgi:glycosyltransferase involved in cell wall biosynthesis